MALLIVILIGLAVALAGSQGGASAFGIPLFAFSVGLAFLIQRLAFIPAYRLQSEKFFDLTGSLTYISVTVIAVLLGPEVDGRSLLLLALVVIWAGRLGTFLFRRIQKAGKDARFDELKPSFLRFLNTWTLQGLWVTLTLAAALAAITTNVRKELGVFALIGFLIWVFGFAIEVVADNQKSRFRADPANEGKFIHTGLWARSRHPNYFGDIVHTPGHSDDSVSLLLDDGSAFTGDLTHPALVGESGVAIVSASWRLLQERGAVRVYPAHGPIRPMHMIE